jgi:hypothetical protein
MGGGKDGRGVKTCGERESGRVEVGIERGMWQ